MLYVEVLEMVEIAKYMKLEQSVKYTNMYEEMGYCESSWMENGIKELMMKVMCWVQRKRIWKILSIVTTAIMFNCI